MKISRFFRNTAIVAGVASVSALAGGGISYGIDEIRKSSLLCEIFEDAKSAPVSKFLEASAAYREAQTECAGISAAGWGATAMLTTPLLLHHRRLRTKIPASPPSPAVC